MIVDAEAEGQKAALRSFAYANAVEQIHAKLYQQAAEKMGALEAADYYVCSVCGNTVENEPPETCPVCGAKAKAFFKVS